MNQQNQIKLLVFSCFFILAGLISIQYYLVQNVYDLEKRNYQQEVKNTIDPVANSHELDVLQDTLQESIKRLVFKKISDSLSEQQFRTLLFHQTDSIRKLGNLFLKSQEKDYPILKELRLRFQYTEIIFRNDSIIDSIVTLTQNPIVFFGHEFDKKESFNLSFGNWYNNSNRERDDVKAINTHNNYWFSIKHSVDVDLSDWEYKVLLRMKWILFAAVGLMIAVILLFFWMYLSLIKQRKIAEIKTDFANNITHELKTPLTSLNLIVKSLQKDEIAQNPEMLKQLNQSMARQNNRIQNIFDRVLESTVENQKIHLQELKIVQFLNEFMMDYSSKTHQITTDFHPSELILETDSYQLGRVLQNVLQNAEKYSPNAKEIHVKAFPNEEFYEIQIQDFGKGIPIQEQKKIFDKFYRISEGNVHNVKGLGLGLYLSQEIIKSLNGQITVESQVGKGSIFTIKIPLK